MTELSEVDGTLHNRATEAKRSDCGLFKLAAWPVFDRVDVMRRIRHGVTLLEFGS
jgi:hypothetical protein